MQSKKKYFVLDIIEQKMLKRFWHWHWSLWWSQDIWPQQHQHMFTLLVSHQCPAPSDTSLCQEIISSSVSHNTNMSSCLLRSVDHNYSFSLLVSASHSQILLALHSDNYWSTAKCWKCLNFYVTGSIKNVTGFWKFFQS